MLVGGGLDYERKYTLPSFWAPTMQALLERCCRQDPLYPEAFVVSIYYDSPQFDSLNEKLNSEYLKTKTRLRWYEDTSGSGISSTFAEVKFRLGNRRRKIRLETNLGAQGLAEQRLDSRELQFLPARLRQLGLDIPANLVPVLEVRYRRRRFEDPATRVRLSLDSEISTSRVNARLLPPVAPRPLSVAVFEVKSADDLPPTSLGQLGTLGCRRTSFSKYSSSFLGIQNRV